ncbi:hypothetical protein PAEPH01_1226 [Pancytospora epiphaga]|nr:hypothetical protein PAEPH01_1226 [Pancytospora epiphaga]
MGNILSRQLSIKEQLQKYDMILQTKEELLTQLRLKQSYSFLYLFGFTSAIIAFLIAFMEDFYPKCVFAFVIVTVAGLRWLFACMHLRKIANLGEEIKELRKKQSALVKEYKKDNNFAFAKKIVEKYEEDESRESFFKHVQKRKKDAVDKMADLILDNDPTKMNALICGSCGLHNGLIDPERDNIHYFYCYSCKAKNMRPIRDEKDIKD